MTALRLSLKPGERIFVNGAVLRADRKVCLELLNNATFLLEHHVMQPAGTTTPLRQLYFMVQSALMEPATSYGATVLILHSLETLKKTFANPEVLAGIDTVTRAVQNARYVDALKTIRKLLPVEGQILGGAEAEMATEERATACR